MAAARTYEVGVKTYDTSILLGDRSSKFINIVMCRGGL
jgi:hypothetical protein